MAKAGLEPQFPPLKPEQMMTQQELSLSECSAERQVCSGEVKDISHELACSQQLEVRLG